MHMNICTQRVTHQVLVCQAVYSYALIMRSSHLAYCISITDSVITDVLAHNKVHPGNTGEI